MKNLQLNSKTTYNDLENYFNNNLLNLIAVDGKREFVFNIGEYGALVFHKCVNTYAENQGLIFINKLKSVDSVLKETIFVEPQFVKYNLHNGIQIKLMIENDNEDDSEIEDLSGYPMSSMLLKFKEII